MSLAQLRRNLLRLCQSEQRIACSGQANHKAGRLHSQRHSRGPALLVDAIQEHGGKVVDAFAVLRLIKNLRRHQQRIQVAHIAVT